MGHHVRADTAADHRTARRWGGRRCDAGSAGPPHRRHADIGPPAVDVHEYTDGPVLGCRRLRIAIGTTDHRRSNRPSRSGWSIRGPRRCWQAIRCCASLDELAAGADALVHTVIRKDLPLIWPSASGHPLDYHSSVEQAERHGGAGGIGTWVLTHYVPPAAAGPGSVAGVGHRVHRAYRARRRSARVEVQ